MSRARTAAVYCRISKDAEQAGLGVARQRKDCIALADREGYQIARTSVFIDDDRSASRFARKSRPAYEEMLSRAEAGEFDALIYYSTSRLTRRMKEWLRIIELVDGRASRRRPIRLRSVVSGEDDLTTADGRMVAKIKASVDEAESERTSERIRAQRRHMAEKGVSYTGGRVYGYEAWTGRRGGGIGDVPVIRESEARVIREMVERILRGESTYSVAQWANQQGHRHRGGGVFTASNVRRLLGSARIAGLIEYKGELFAGLWPAIVPMEQWQQVHEVFARTAGRPGGGKSGLSLLNGLIRCGACGATMAASRTPDRYRCRNNACNLTRNRSKLEAYVIQRWGWQMSELSGTDEWVQELASVTAPVADNRAVDDQISKIEKRLKDLHEAYRRGAFDDDFENYLNLKNELVADKHALEQEKQPVTVDPQAAFWDAVNQYVNQHGDTSSPSPGVTIGRRAARTKAETEAAAGATWLSGSWRAVLAFHASSDTAYARELLGLVIDRVVVLRPTVKHSRIFRAEDVHIEWRRQEAWVA